MRYRQFALSLLMLTAPASAQQKLAYLLPHLYGPNGLTVDSEALLPSGATHSAHFNSSFQQSFSPFNSALASQLASVPLPSPASGFTYALDPALGVFTRSTQSFGPILSDRADTLGKERVSLGFSYQRFSFDTLDGQDLQNIPAVFTHDSPAPGGRDDVITTVNAIDVELSQATFVANYGISDRLDVSVAIPFVAVDLAASSLATIQRIGTSANPAVHFFYKPTGDHYGTQATFRTSGNAAGIGDIVLRLKAVPIRKGGTGVAVGIESRLPTGDEKDLLGSGAWGVKPFVVFSSTHKVISPHLKAAYQWNGKSLLAGDIAGGVDKDMSDQIHLEAGTEFNLAKKVTVVADLLGRRVIDGERLQTVDFHALDNRSVFPNIRFETSSFNTLDGALGLKANPGGNLLIEFNVLFKLNSNGLRDKVTPLLGVEFSF